MRMLKICCICFELAPFSMTDLNQTHLDQMDTFKLKEQTDIGEDNDTNTKDTQLYDRQERPAEAGCVPTKAGCNGQ